VLAAIIGDSRYAVAFGLVAVLPLLAVGTTPVRAERRAARVGQEQVVAAGAATTDC
jgi:hypothetical protein